MSFNDLGVADLATQGAAAGGLGMLGRLLALARASSRPTGWSLLWEIPIACGMGVVGKGLAEAVGVDGFQHYAVVIAVAYAGPRMIDIILVRYGLSLAAREAPAPEPKPETKPEKGDAP